MFDPNLHDTFTLTHACGHQTLVIRQDDDITLMRVIATARLEALEGPCPFCQIEANEEATA